MLSWYKKKRSQTLIIVVGFIAGILLGSILPKIALALSFLGTIYINLLKLLIVPVLFFSITSALCSSSSIKYMGNLTIKTVGLFVLMFCVSFLITYGFVSLINPGEGFLFISKAWSGEVTSTTISDFIVALFPTNILSAASTNTILPVILFAFAIGIACKLTNSNKDFFISGNTIFNKILSWVIYLTPIGVFSLMGNTVATYGISIFVIAIKYIGIAWLSCILVCGIVMILPIWTFCKINPIEYIKKVSKVWLISLSTCSSSATLPVTIKTCNEDFGIPESITNIVVPLGCTIHMCGGAISFALLSVFNAQMFGVPITIGMFGIMLSVALLINMGAPGIPGGGIVLGATYLNILGMPIDFIGFYAGIYRLLDMPYTTMNVTGDISANILLNNYMQKHSDTEKKIKE